MTALTDRERIMLLEATLTDAWKRIARLEVALEPFAELRSRDLDGHGDIEVFVDVRDLRRARALLKKEDGE